MSRGFLVKRNNHCIRRWDVINHTQLVVRIRDKEGTTTVTVIRMRKFKYKWQHRICRLWLRIRYI